jgi:uncharacterized delta-60 repeat protein
MKMVGRSWGAAFACFLVGLVWFVGMARGNAMTVKADGKIVVTGWTVPQFGALAQLNPDGTLDRSFGRDGYLLDPRLPSFVSVAQQGGGGGEPGDRTLAGAVGGFRLARYAAAGGPDLSFGHAGIGGTAEPDQPHFELSNFGPTSLLVRPDRSIVVGGNRTPLGAGDAEALVRLYSSTGDLIETIGRVPPLGGAADASYLHDLIEADDGTLYGVGSTYEVAETRMLPFLARFVPGSGSDFDRNFAGGQGLARVDLPASPRFPSSFNALARQGRQLLAAGRHGGTFLLVRFGADGGVNTEFGNDGYVLPAIVGPGNGPEGRVSPEAESWANDVAVGADGDIVTVGGTSQWGDWKATKVGSACEDCPQPMLARFDSEGNLDPGFGSGGLLRLLRPDGSAFTRAEARQVVASDDGKLLVEGTVQLPDGVRSPFVARLNADGSYDRSFGTAGLTLLDFPCAEGGEREKQILGCIPHVRSKLRLSGMRRGRPAVLLRVRPSKRWAGIDGLSLTLPRGMRLRKSFLSKMRVIPVGSTEAEKMQVHLRPPVSAHGRVTMDLERFGIASEVRVRLPRTSLRVNRHLRTLRPHRKVGFGVGAYFAHLGWGGWCGFDASLRRVG